MNLDLKLIFKNSNSEMALNSLTTFFKLNNLYLPIINYFYYLKLDQAN